MFETVVFRARFDASGLRTGAKVHRPALLFRAGDYPDKGVSITPADLDGIIARFNGRKEVVPVRAEHRESPLDPLGEVAALYREGDELYAMLHFSDGMAAHIEERGARNLSVSLLRDGDGFTMDEVSLVFAGRVEGAGFLPRPASLVTSELARFRQAGKLTPAMASHAAALLSAPSRLQFADGSVLDVATETIALLEAIPGRLGPQGNGVPRGATFTHPENKSGIDTAGLDAGQQAFIAALGRNASGAGRGKER